MPSKDDDRLLVPVADSVTLRETVAYALDSVADAGETDTSQGSIDSADHPAVHFVYVVTSRAPEVEALDEPEAADELLERIAVWAEEDLGPDGPDVAVETAAIGRDRYLFGPPDYASILVEYAREHDLDRILLDPEYAPGGTAPMLQPLQAELALADVAYEEAPVDRPARRSGLARAGTFTKYLVVFAVTYGFYLAIGELSTFDLVTGAATAAVVAAIVAPVSFSTQPSLGRLIRQTVRLVIYTPYLLWQIVKANIAIAYVVLHPSLPIDPKVVRFRGAVWGDIPVTTLANSITLTPGTLTVDVRERSYVIHTLTRSAREDLFDGALERAVRYVFWGRGAARIPSPRERAARRADTDEEPESQSATGTDAPAEGSQ